MNRRGRSQSEYKWLTNTLAKAFAFSHREIQNPNLTEILPTSLRLAIGKKITKAVRVGEGYLNESSNHGNQYEGSSKKQKLKNLKI